MSRANKVNEVKDEIEMVLRMLSKVGDARQRFIDDSNPKCSDPSDVDPSDVVRNLTTCKVLKDHLRHLRCQEASLELQAQTSLWSTLQDFHFMDKLLELQRDSAAAVGVLAAAGATVAITLMYSASRGNMWFPSIAWYLFGASMTATTSLALATSGIKIPGADDLTSPSQNTKVPNLFPQALSVFAVIISLLCCAGGWAALAGGTVTYNLHNELNSNENPKLSGGPSFTEDGVRTTLRALGYLVVSITGCIPLVCYALRLWTHLRPNSSRP